MKKLTYILLFIWNIGIGQTELIIGDVIYSKGVEGLDTELSPFKYDTVKALFLISDTGTYTIEIDTRVPAITLEFREKGIYTRQDKSNWLYGYVINSIDYVYTSCNGHEAGIMCERRHYKPIRTPRGYLTLDKKPFSKEIIIWDYKIIE